MDLATLVGTAAAGLTSLSYLPQVCKAWPAGATDGLSWRTLVVLTAGLMGWIGYGLMKGDWVLVAANFVGATLSGAVLLLKVRDMWGLNKLW
ncbi:SemiSWEET family sugar transporter [Bradyrhizobium sp. SYSU BS000235]|uniref:SemiSWEET family sugar transporter n=1 Tax=Bradyrhizobium sp. SYSU BS000235 TaxID=3411332 RepID=UPI003C757A16